MRRLLSIVVLAFLAMALVACGATAPTKTVTVVSPPPNALKPVSKRKAKPYPKRTARKSQRSRAASTSPKPVFRVRCDQDITARAGTTSCPFASNVFWSFSHAREAGESSFTAYSPATKQDYDLTCTTGSLVTCRAGDGGEVQFPLTAVQAYSSAQADRYAATHDTGQAPEPEPPPKPQAPADSGANCDPNYADQCLDPNAYDYDCEGGTGDGPKYTGPVRAVGDDPYDLDRDGDGVACEPY
jgi:hypothetical protein